MSVDSGLPSFRGTDGFWSAYPPYRDLELKFSDLSSPQCFRENPWAAWGFYGHRLNLYRDTKPHRGFRMLNEWGDRANDGYFVFTSNVDGHFQRSGFDSERIEEHHGSIHHVQCRGICPGYIFPADDLVVSVDASSMLADPPLPVCDRCGAGVRPNVLMFGDDTWAPSRTEAQRKRYKQWLRSVRGKNVAVIEIGAGTAIPSVTEECSGQARRLRGTLIRINVDDSMHYPGICLPMRALDALTSIDAALTDPQS